MPTVTDNFMLQKMTFHIYYAQQFYFKFFVNYMFCYT